MKHQLFSRCVVSPHLTFCGNGLMGCMMHLHPLASFMARSKLFGTHRHRQYFWLTLATDLPGVLSSLAISVHFLRANRLIVRGVHRTIRHKVPLFCPKIPLEGLRKASKSGGKHVLREPTPPLVLFMPANTSQTHRCNSQT